MYAIVSTSVIWFFYFLFNNTMSFEVKIFYMLATFWASWIYWRPRFDKYSCDTLSGNEVDWKNTLE